MKIKGLNYNWFFSVTENSTGFDSAYIGYDNIINIEEHKAQGDGDKWYYDVFRSDGSIQRIFNPNQVYFIKEEQK
jgi:hypothetical protein